MSKIYVGRVGLKISLDPGPAIDLSNADVLQIAYRTPRRVEGVLGATLVNGKVEATIDLVGSLSVSGTWRVQLYAEGAGYKMLGDTYSFIVSRKFT